MNAKVFATIAALLIIFTASIANADWLDDLTSGTDRLVQSINENAAKVNQLTDNLGIVAHILQQVDADQSKSNEE